MDISEEKSSQYDLKIPEKFYEELYSKADILYFSVDEDCLIRSYNITFQEKLGYDKKELLGKNFLTLFKEKECSNANEFLNICLVKGYIKDESISFLDKEGHNLNFKLSGLAIRDEIGNSTIVRFYAQDVTEMLKLQSQNNFTSQILKKLKQGMSEEYIKDILEEIKKYTNSDCIGLSLYSEKEEKLILWDWKSSGEGTIGDGSDFRHFTPDIWKNLINRWSQTQSGHSTPNGSFWVESLSDLILELKPGDEKDILLSLADYNSFGVILGRNDSKTWGYIIIAHKEYGKWKKKDIELLEEITSVLTLEKQNKNSTPIEFDDKLSFLMKMTIMGILVVQDSIIQSVNHWIEDFLGLSIDELHGKSIWDYIEPSDHEKVQTLYNAESLNEDAKDYCEVAVLTKEGKQQYIECAIVRIPENNNYTDFWFWISKEEQVRLQNNLMRARKMESLGMLAGGIVHDFQNQLATILGYSSLLIEEIPKSNSYYDDIQQIAQISEKATELTSRLLAYARGKPYVVSELQINPLIKEVATILSSTLNKKITIQADLDQNLILIHGDANQIQQTTLQVALNVQETMPNGGKLIFKTRNILLKENDPRLHLGGKSGKYVQITISATGSGMGGQIKGQIFELDFSKRDQNQIKELGLSVVQEIIEKNGGFISVFSEKGSGTVSKIYLPAIDKKIQKSMHVYTDKPVLGKETILLIDDEKVIRETARRMLTRYGYKVISAENGTEAIAIYKKNQNRIDLIVMDLIMPGVDINKILGWLKKLNPKVKIIATAGLGERELVQKELRKNLSGYIKKPFQVRPLLKKIHTILNA
jgi:PAS domain S-box-containing protein